VFCGSLVVRASATDSEKPAVVKYLRFEAAGKTAYGILEGDRVRQLDGDLFGIWKETETTHALKDVKLLVPTQPTQVLAMAGNYKSHLKDAEIPPKFMIPQPFFKSPSCLVQRRQRTLLVERRREHGRAVVAGQGGRHLRARRTLHRQRVDYDDLRLRLRLNGEVRQEERTSLFINDIATQVSFISKHVTLHPGDLIYTGTPGKTDLLEPGDVVEGVGVLRNKVVAEK
jgi:2-keto-4-pentenoate hydratase/2-oxohepta-3-ene-1,7-dioic acid hydratase in catechol pathway